MLEKCRKLKGVFLFFFFILRGKSSSSSWLDKTVYVWSERLRSVGPALCKILSDCPSGARLSVNPA